MSDIIKQAMIDTITLQNEDEIKARQKIQRRKYYEANIEETRADYQENKKELKYYYDNREEILAKIDKVKQRELSANYYSQNKERILADRKAKRAEKRDCECGGKYNLQNPREHLRSKRHTNYLSAKQVSVKQVSAKQERPCEVVN